MKAIFLLNLLLLSGGFWSNTYQGQGCSEDPTPIILHKEDPAAGKPRSIVTETVTASYSQEELYIEVSGYYGVVNTVIEDNLGNTVLSDNSISTGAAITIPLDSLLPDGYKVKITTTRTYWGNIYLF